MTTPPTADPAENAVPETSAPRPAEAVLSAGTLDGIREPRSQNRLPLGDGVWYQISPRYIVAQVIANVIMLVIVAAIAVALWLLLDQTWVWIPAAAIAAITLIGLLIAGRQARSIGYQLRDDDLVFRRGILWQRIVAVPYGRMQLVDITHGPLDRGLGIAQLKLVTAAAATGVSIPGLTQDAAEVLRDTLIDVAETRRTGL